MLPHLPGFSRAISQALLEITAHRRFPVDNRDPKEKKSDLEKIDSMADEFLV